MTDWGKTRRRLARLLEAEGFQVDALTAAQGYWRTDVRADVNRWEGAGRANGRAGLSNGTRVQFSSWDPMTLCVRNGIQVASDGMATSFDVSANGKVS
jgi:hypothetical protein